MQIDKLELQNQNLMKLFKKGQKWAVAMGVSLALVGCSFGEDKVEEPVTISIDHMISDHHVSIDNINALNIILCNNQCRTDIFDGTVQKLKDHGISFEVAESMDSILEKDHSTIITMAGLIYDSDSSVLLGQYNNEKNNHSDILALAMQAGFKESGCKIDGIRPGVSEVNHEMGITSRVPTATENMLGNGSSFVAIALGTHLDDIQAEKISDGILAGLVRTAYEVKENPREDYLYRIGGYDTIEGMAVEMGTSVDALVQVNSNLAEDLIQKDDFITHPKAVSRDFVSDNVDFTLVNISTKSQSR